MNISIILIIIYIIGFIIFYFSVKECDISFRDKRLIGFQCRLFVSLIWLPILIKAILNKNIRIDL